MAAHDALVDLQHDLPISLSIVACEEAEHAFERLKAGISRFSDAGINAYPFKGKWDDHTDAICDLIRATPTLIFVDPFGFKGIEMSALIKLAQAPSSVDILWKLEDEAVARVAAETPHILDSATGSTLWQFDFPWDGSPTEKAEFVSDAICDPLSSALGKNGRHRYFQLTAQSHHREVKFTMVLVSRSTVAFGLFTDLIAKAVNLVQIGEGSEQIGLFDQLTTTGKRFALLKEGIVRYLEGVPKRRSIQSYQNILDHVVMKCPSTVERKEITSAIRSLQKDDDAIRKMGYASGYVKDSFRI